MLDQGLVELKLLALALYFADCEVSVFLRKLKHGIRADLSLRLAVIQQPKSKGVEFRAVLTVQR